MTHLAVTWLCTETIHNSFEAASAIFYCCEL